jgi:hypothetical protein
MLKMSKYWVEYPGKVPTNLVGIIAISVVLN